MQLITKIKNKKTFKDYFELNYLKIFLSKFSIQNVKIISRC
jgi:hypothetical protein